MRVLALVRHFAYRKNEEFCVDKSTLRTEQGRKNHKMAKMIETVSFIEIVS